MFIKLRKAIELTWEAAQDVNLSLQREKMESGRGGEETMLWAGTCGRAAL
jgi:hypothetical protein